MNELNYPFKRTQRKTDVSVYSLLLLCYTATFLIIILICDVIKFL